MIEACRQHDLPLFLEPLPATLDQHTPLTLGEYREVVVENARIFCAMGIDVLKTPFPVDVMRSKDESVWADALQDLAGTITVPWALLSLGVRFDLFKRQAELACEAGASGVIVGRAVWGEAVALHDTARTDFLAKTARDRMEELATLCEWTARPWHDLVPKPDSAPGWYKLYDDGAPTT
ncbi:MAG: hypothetical protein GYB67_04905 [Chloroflexi bacterium]|nr:hypothetical protein [Chloroflexota bacterium]